MRHATDVRVCEFRGEVRVRNVEERRRRVMELKGSTEEDCLQYCGRDSVVAESC